MLIYFWAVGISMKSEFSATQANRLFREQLCHSSEQAVFTVPLKRTDCVHSATQANRLCSENNVPLKQTDCVHSSTQANRLCSQFHSSEQTVFTVPLKSTDCVQRTIQCHSREQTVFREQFSATQENRLCSKNNSVPLKKTDCVQRTIQCH